MERAETSRIRIAFLGADDSTPELVAAVLADGRYQLIGICLTDAAGQKVEAPELEALGRIPAIEPWETLLDNARVDLVVVASSHEEDFRAEQLRKLIQTGVPLLACHPVVSSMLVYYELDMIRRDTGS